MQKYTRQFMNEVKKYLDGISSRTTLEQDLTFYFIHLADQMEREDEELFHFINYAILENGLERGESYSDAAFRRLMKKQYNEVLSAIRTGII